MTGRKFIKLYTEIVNGICPTCDEYTMLVGVTRSFYRCMSCGSDLEQNILMAKKSKFGVNTYVKRSKPRIGRHKKRMNKSEKRSYKKYIGQGR